MVSALLKDFFKDVGGTFGDVRDIAGGDVRGTAGAAPGAPLSHLARTPKAREAYSGKTQ